MALGAPAMLALLALIPAAAIGWWWLWRARRLHRTAVAAQVAGVRQRRLRRSNNPRPGIAPDRSRSRTTHVGRR